MQLDRNKGVITLFNLQINRISIFSKYYMHSVLLGEMKKLLTFWTYAKKNMVNIYFQYEKLI